MNPLPMLRELLNAAPFKPFALCLTDGRKLPVLSRDHLTVTAQGRILWEGDNEEEFAMAMPLHVTGVEDLRRKRAAR
jgi:hypothetical protein